MSETTILDELEKPLNISIPSRGLGKREIEAEINSSSSPRGGGLDKKLEVSINKFSES